MIIPVHMLAFENDKDLIREVEIPDEELISSKISSGEQDRILHILELVFRYGQNDFQPKPMRSVSVGDVIELENQYHMVKSVGFEPLDTTTYGSLVAPTSMMGYGMKGG